jgi:protoporphyrinogen oxidase
MKPIVIAGAGIAGLTLAYKLVNNGKKVVIVEKESAIGGLSRSFQYNGFIFDIGPHRFHTDNKTISDFIIEVLKEDVIIIPRKSGVWMFDQYFEWPLAFETIFKLPPKFLLLSFFDLLSKKEMKNNSFEEYILSKYGKTLYKIFFKPYTEKFLKIDCSQIHFDWAESGVNRAVIDKNVKMGSLADVIKSVLMPKPVTTFFYYPESGGIDIFAKKMADCIRSKGGIILTDAEITKIELIGNRINTVEINGKEKISVEDLIWSAPVSRIAKLLDLEDPNLNYLSLICCNIMVNHPPFIDYQWTYYGGESMIFVRTSVPTLFNINTSPPGKSGICAEITCMENDDSWQYPEKYKELIEKSLINAKLIKNKDEIIDIRFEKIRNAYPIYTIDYHEKLETIMKELNKYSNLRMLGRTGTFWYNNMDHSIKMSLDMANMILSGAETEFKRKL